VPLPILTNHLADEGDALPVAWAIVEEPIHVGVAAAKGVITQVLFVDYRHIQGLPDFYHTLDCLWHFPMFILKDPLILAGGRKHRTVLGGMLHPVVFDNEQVLASQELVSPHIDQ
jgi:hypothetical protein